MELLFEIIFSIIFEGSIEVMQTRKLPRWLRIICTIIVILIFSFVISMIGILALFMWRENQLMAILFLIIDVIFITSIIKKIRKIKNHK